MFYYNRLDKTLLKYTFFVCLAIQHEKCVINCYLGILICILYSYSVKCDNPTLINNKTQIHYACIILIIKYD